MIRRCSICFQITLLLVESLAAMLHVPNGSLNEYLGRLLSHGGQPSHTLVAGFLLALGKRSLLLTHLSKDFGPDRVVEDMQLARSGGMRNSLMEAFFLAARR
jgi:hypothetical protein